MPLFRLSLSTEEHIHSLHDVILLWIVRVLFAGNFQYSRDGLVVIFQYMSNVIGNVLCNQNDSDIVPLRKCLEGILHLHKLRVGLDDQKVGRVGRSVANSSEEETSYGVLYEPSKQAIRN